MRSSALNRGPPPRSPHKSGADGPVAPHVTGGRGGSGCLQTGRSGKASLRRQEWSRGLGDRKELACRVWGRGPVAADAEARKQG